MNRTLRQRILFAALFGMVIPLQANAGTSAFDLNVKSVVEAGTCTASIYDGASQTNTIPLGNVPISQVINYTGNPGKAFTLRFSDCAGLPQGTATLVITRRSTPNACPGSDSNQAGFPNDDASAGSASTTALELWSGSTAGAGTQFHCFDKIPQDIDVSRAKGATTVDFPMSARLAKVYGKADNLVKAGTFISQTLFTITYK